MPEDTLNFKSVSVQQTRMLAKQLAETLKGGDCLALYGNLGAGKSEFVRGIIQTLNKNQIDVTSPTFSLVKPYKTRIGTVFHIDLYRLNSKNELFELGFPDILSQGVCVIEWPQLTEALLSKETLRICFETLGDSEREIKFEVNTFWRQRLSFINPLPTKSDEQ
ncbi:MAG: tRNA (adenosine(37)-N6)-threonylcarbamoyltransferase complex ATPase subunit type 1 TsaE [Holosporales bacterium]|jgi:tRNA threonylcarbamoyl adenosine modification protein YjeE|nr:tRNA (adenosine(37)-N6)-threonylcarbamoyltransferase complex ATPase subunit type 1 TsaE [Holosporales bacterium]